MQHQIFRAGTRRDNNGRLVTITEADVAQAAAAYDAQNNPAPIVIGHPSADAPAYGWVGGLAADGGLLSAEFSQVDGGFADLVRRGRYKKVSASFYPPEHPDNPSPGSWYLRHVGFLGAAAPAVKGLAPISFAADADGIVEFCEPPVVQTQQDDAAEDDPNQTFHTNPKQGDDMSQTVEQQLAAEKAAREAAEAKAQNAEAELQKFKDEQAKAERDAAHRQNADFAENLVKTGRLKPADKTLVVQALDFAEYPEHYTADFGEDGTKKTIAAALRDFLQAVLPTNALNRETAVGQAADFAENGQSHHERALALAKAEGISYEAAARRTAQY